MKLVIGRSEETRRATPYDSLRENPIMFGFAEGRSSLFQSLFNTKKYKVQPKGCSLYLVGVKRLELPTFWSQTRRATNCATPRLKICLQSIDIITNNATVVNTQFDFFEKLFKPTLRPAASGFLLCFIFPRCQNFLPAFLLRGSRC